MRITFLITFTDKNPKQIHHQSPQMYNTNNTKQTNIGKTQFELSKQTKV